MTQKNDSNTIDLNEFKALLTGHWLTDLSNANAYLNENLSDINWVGFYLNDGTKLRLGPFIGRPACVEIPFSKGVCGTSFAEQKSLVVDDVDLFPGHIRCDERSRSEVVIPLTYNNRQFGVLDIDSPTVGRFKKDIIPILENLVRTLLKNMKPSSPLYIQG